MVTEPHSSPKRASLLSHIPSTTIPSHRFTVNSRPNPPLKGAIQLVITSPTFHAEASHPPPSSIHGYEMGVMQARGDPEEDVVFCKP